MRIIFYIVLVGNLLMAQSISAQEVEGRLVELDALEQLASQSDLDSPETVTVLLPLLKADIVHSATSVERTFTGKDKPNIEPVSSSQAVFITGRPAMVLEAVARLKALDEATPEPKERSRFPAKSSNNPPLDPEEIAKFGPDVDSISGGLSIFGIGVLLILVLAVVLLRSSFR